MRGAGSTPIRVRSPHTPLELERLTISNVSVPAETHAGSKFQNELKGSQIITLFEYLEILVTALLSLYLLGRPTHPSS